MSWDLLLLALGLSCLAVRTGTKCFVWLYIEFFLQILPKTSGVSEKIGYKGVSFFCIRPKGVLEQVGNNAMLGGVPT